MDENLYEDGPSWNKFVVRLSEFQGHRFLDLRSWYLDKKTKEYRSTKKGITLNAKKYAALTGVISDNDELISDWLSGEATADHVSEYQARQETTREQETFAKRLVSATTEESGQNSCFFYSEHRGGRDHIVLNDDNTFVKRILALIEVSSEADEIWDIFQILLVSYARSRARLKDSTGVDANTMFEMLELDWSRYLTRAV